jgi:Kae1-associated kinase Bud32
MLWREGQIYFIDFGLGMMSDGLEARGVDLRVLREAFGGTHARLGGCFEVILKGYCESFDGGGEVIHRMDEIASRGRYTE